MLNKLSNIINVLYIVVLIATVMELIFVHGMFTGIFSCIIIGIVTLLQCIFSIINKKYYIAVMTVIQCITMYYAYYAIIN